MATPLAGSLDELVHTRIAEILDCGIDSPVKLRLIESSWRQPTAGGTTGQFVTALQGSASSETIQKQLEQLVESGLFVCCKGSCPDKPGYSLTSDPAKRQFLMHLMDLWSDPSFRTRAVAQLRYRSS